jgi:hypothetical protein
MRNERDKERGMEEGEEGRVLRMGIVLWKHSFSK